MDYNPCMAKKMLTIEELPIALNRIVGVMVRARARLDLGFDCRSGQTKDPPKHSALRTKSNDWLARNQDNVSQRGNMFIRELLFQ